MSVKKVAENNKEVLIKAPEVRRVVLNSANYNSNPIQAA